MYKNLRPPPEMAHKDKAFDEAFRRQFYPHESDQDENAKLEQNAFQNYKWPYLAFKWVSKASTMHIGRRQDGKPAHFGRGDSSYRFHNPFEDYKSRPCCTRYTRIRFACDLALSSLLIALILMTFRRDYIMDYGRPNVKSDKQGNASNRQTSNKSSSRNLLHEHANCAPINETYYVNEAKLAELRMWDSILGWLGDPLRYSVGLGQFLLCCMFVALQATNLLEYMRHGEEIRIDALCFLCNPTEEKAFMCELSSKMLDKRRPGAYLSNSRCFKMLPDARRESRRQASIKFPRPNVPMDINNSIIDEIQRNRLVKPGYLNDETLKASIGLINGAAGVNLLCSALGVYLASAAYIGFELYIRSEQRLKIFECQSLGLEYVAEHVHLPELHFQWQRDLYHDYDGSLGHRLKLIYPVEYSSWNSWQNVVLGMTMIVLVLPNLAMVLCIVIIYTWTVNHIIIWLKQLNGQLRACIELLEMHERILAREFCRDYGEIGFHNHHYPHGSDHAQRERLGKILLGLEVTLVNFELFHSRFRHVKKATDIVTSIAVLSGASMILLTIGTNRLLVVPIRAEVLVVDELTSLVIADIGIFFFQNIELKMIGLSRLMSKLVARCCLSGLSSSSTVYHLRSRIMTEYDVTKNYSPRICGFTTPRQEFVTLNVVAVIFAWLIYTRKQSILFL